MWSTLIFNNVIYIYVLNGNNNSLTNNNKVMNKWQCDCCVVTISTYGANRSTILINSALLFLNT